MKIYVEEIHEFFPNDNIRDITFKNVYFGGKLPNKQYPTAYITKQGTTKHSEWDIYHSLKSFLKHEGLNQKTLHKLINQGGNAGIKFFRTENL